MIGGRRGVTATALLAATLALVGPVAPRAEDIGETQQSSNEAAMHPSPELARKLITVAPGLQIDIWAAEPLLANPVAFGLDERGRAYVVETYRHSEGGLDNRGRRGWLSESFKKSATSERLAGIEDELLDRELAARTLGDREAMVKEFMDHGFMTKHADRIVVVEDRNGDGKAETSRVFAGGFNGPLDGLGASVLARKGDVFFTDIPSLWLLRDNDGDGKVNSKADTRRALHTGFGVRYAFIGHDLHGLRIGPDGRLYFTVGDRGAHIDLADGRALASPESGAVFRCELDGSGLEIFSTGLRNPQDLVFDQYGNLFTGDNNSDGGDEARWVYLVEGGDSGWRIGYQYIEQPVARGPWNVEKMWQPHWDGQPAHLIPPVKNIGNGPSGVAYHPGTGLGKEFAGHFFLVDFKGQHSISGIHTFTLKPQGAGFEMVNPRHFAWGLLATDADFGPDGALYVTDWVQGWPKPGKGRIWRISDPAAAKDPVVAGTRRLLADGMAKRSNLELAALLGHADIRVRQEAQFQLVDVGAYGLLNQAARGSSDRLARLHGIWGLGQLMRRAAAKEGKQGAASSTGGAVAETLLGLLQDKDDEVRAQAVKTLGDGKVTQMVDAFATLLKDPSPRVRFFAALGIGRIGRREALPIVTEMLRENADRDPYLRHAGVMAFAGVADATAIAQAAKDASRAVRLVALLALRRQHAPELQQFLADRDPMLVREAARAINDDRIDDAADKLAGLKLATKPDPATAWRVVNANFRAGTSDGAKRLAALTTRADLPPQIRSEAVTALGDWTTPGNRDRVTGLFRPLAQGGPVREPGLAGAALAPKLAALLAATTPEPVRAAAIAATQKLKVAVAAPRLAQLVADRKGAPHLRLAALRALGDIRPASLAVTVKRAAGDPDPRVRTLALRLQLELDPAGAPARLREVMAGSSVADQQTAVAALARVAPESADQLLGEWMDAMDAGKLPPEITLDLLEAATKSAAAAVKQKVERFEARRPQDELGPYREALTGGSVEQGRNIFLRRAEASCKRCHKLAGEGGDVGPELAGVAKTRSREYLLASLVLPSRDFAPGFESVIVTAKDGSIHGGIVKRETDLVLELLSPEKGADIMTKADVKLRERGASGMPEGFGQILSKRDLRDLVEFLSTLR